ncbi:hypothetical protein [Lysobacter enzymogenes]|uniref:hypothetical protein n=1 Tax=Lysobacter enzymogenes TaxID=69 RepID=UPI001A9674E3|nr:hypothetical protein [Lysobacter enzymogenes]QQP98408.1 hypothetical protein JHW38_10695 [Lysobacter enzymogenes]
MRITSARSSSRSDDTATALTNAACNASAHHSPQRQRGQGRNENHDMTKLRAPQRSTRKPAGGGTARTAGAHRRHAATCAADRGENKSAAARQRPRHRRPVVPANAGIHQGFTQTSP